MNSGEKRKYDVSELQKIASEPSDDKTEQPPAEDKSFNLKIPGLYALVAFFFIFALPEWLRHNQSLYYPVSFWCILCAVATLGPILIYNFLTRNIFVLAIAPFAGIFLTFSVDEIKLSEPTIIRSPPVSFWMEFQDRGKERIRLYHVVTAAGHDIVITPKANHAYRRGDSFEYELQVGLLGINHTSKVNFIQKKKRK